MMEPLPESAPPPWTLRGDAAAVLYPRGILAFLRYHASNVGPYDELLWLEPFRRGPGGWRHRITRIFVSSEASVQNGRANWGLPKELATFRLSALGARSERVEVSQAGQAIASFTWARRGPVLAWDASRFPRQARSIVQLSAGRYFETVPSARGHCQWARISALQVNPEVLPQVFGRWRLGFCLRNFELIFPAARIFDAPA
jgi:hypothetical protein